MFSLGKIDPFGGEIYLGGVDSTNSDLPILLRGRKLAHWDTEPVKLKWTRGVRDGGTVKGLITDGWRRSPQM